MREGMNTGSVRFGGPDRRIFGSRFLRVLFVLLLWAGGFYTLLVLRAPDALEMETPTPGIPAPSSGDTSACGPIRYIKRDPQHANRLQFSVSLEGMTVTPGNLGFFKTGLFKTVQVRSLQVRRYEYESDPGTPGPGTIPEETALRALALGHPEWVNGAFVGDQEPFRLGQGMEIRVDRPDVSDAGQIVVENFDYRIVCEGRPRLSIACKRAMASWDQSGILLRGGVVVTAADGGTVRSNRIRWIPRDRVFSVEDNFLLTAGPTRIAGKSIYLDEQLHIIDAAQAVSNRHQAEGTNYARR